MTTFASGLKNTAAPALDDRITAFDDPQPDDLETAFNRTMIDAAVSATRRTTPPGAAEKRHQPRLSIGELNRMDWDQVRERFESMPEVDSRPPIVRFLDIIDVPRNLMANGITAAVLPSARKRAIERGDKGATGLPKVYAADMLRSMGVKNNIVAGVVGFAGDMAIDPLSWVGGPLGGMGGRTAAGRRAMLGATARKTFNRSMKQLRRGETVADDAWRELFEATAARHGFDLAEKGSHKQVAKHLIGDPSKGWAKALDVATLTRSGAGGDLAEGIYTAAGELVSTSGKFDDATRRQIHAAKAVNQKYHLNRGVKLTEDSVVPLAHVPLTDITLYAPRPWRTVTVLRPPTARAAAAATDGGPPPPSGPAPTPSPEGPKSPPSPQDTAPAAPSETPTSPESPTSEPPSVPVESTGPKPFGEQQRDLLGQPFSEPATGGQRGMFGDMSPDESPAFTGGDEVDAAIRAKYAEEATPTFEEAGVVSSSEDPGAVPARAPEDDPDFDPFDFADEAAAYAEEARHADAEGSRGRDGIAGIREEGVGPVPDGVGESPSGGVPSEPGAAEAAGPTPSFGKGARRDRRNEFSRARLERDLTEAGTSAASGVAAYDPIDNVQALINEAVGVTEDGEPLLSFTTSFAGDLPTEVEELLGSGATRAKRSAMISTNTGKKSTGADVVDAIGADAFVRALDEIADQKPTRWVPKRRPDGTILRAPSKDPTKPGKPRREMVAGSGSVNHTRRALEKMGDHGPPDLRFKMWLYDNLPKRGQARGATKMDVVPNPSSYLDEGAEFTVAGQRYTIDREGDHLVAIGASPDAPTVYLDDLESLPIDQGSLARAGAERMPVELKRALFSEFDEAIDAPTPKSPAETAAPVPPGGGSRAAGGGKPPPPPPEPPLVHPGGQRVPGPPVPQTMKVPLFRTGFLGRIGRQAEIQRAFGLAQQGELHDAGLLMRLSTLVQEMHRNVDELSVFHAAHARLTDDVARGARSPEDAKAGLDMLEDEIARRVAFAELMGTQYKTVRESIQKGAELYSVEGIADLLVAQRLVEHLDDQLRHTAQLSNFRNAIPSLEEISYARDIRKSNKLKAGIKATEKLDELDPTDARLLKFRQIAEEMVEEQADLADNLYALTDASFAKAEQLAEAYSGLMDTTIELAGQAKMPMAKLLTDKNARHLWEASREILRIDSDLPFQSMVKLASLVGPEPEAKVAAWLRTAATNFGGVEGATAAVADQLLSAIRGRGSHVAEQLTRNFFWGGGRFRKGLYQIGEAHLGKGWKKHAAEIEAIVMALGHAKAQRGHPGHWKASVRGHKSVPTSITRWLNEATRKGLTSNAELMSDLDALADDAADLFRSMGVHALDERQVGALVRRGWYSPNRLTDEATRRLRNQKANVMRGSAQEPLERAREDWQQARNMVEIRFKAPNGKTFSFLWLERGFLKGISEEDLIRVGAQHGKRAERELRMKKAIIELFDTQVAPDVADHAKVATWGKPIDPFTMNDRARRGEYSYLFGGKLIGDEMWELTLGEAIARRGASAVVADAKAAMIEGVLRPVVMPIGTDPETLSLMQQPGAKIKGMLGGGVELEVITAPTGDKSQGVRLRAADGTVYVPIPTAPFQDAAFDLYDWIKEGGSGIGFVPEPIAASINRLYDAMSPKEMGQVLKAADMVTRMWRSSTLFHPSWAATNAIGNGFLLAMAFPHMLPTAIKNLMWAQRVIVADMYGTVGDKAPAWKRRMFASREALDAPVMAGHVETTARELLDASGAWNVKNSGQSVEAHRDWFENARPPTPTYPTAGNRRNFRERFAISMAESAVLNTGRNKSYLTDGYDRLRAFARALGTPAGKPFAEWFKINGAIDDTFRLAAFKSYLDEGYDVPTAALKTKESMLNFGDMSSFEMQYMRTLFPFYSWVKASLPNMVRKLYQEPRYFATIPKLQVALEEALAGEDRLPMHMRPTWVQQQTAIQFGHNPEARHAFLAGTLVPQEQAMRAVTGVAGAAGFVAENTLGVRLPFAGHALMDSADFWVSQTSPLLQVPMDIGRGRQGFTGRKIGPTQFEGDMSLLGYLSGQVRWFNELGVGSADPGPVQRAFAKGPASGMSRLLIGGRVQDISDEKVGYSLVREMRDHEESLRRVHRRAMMNGDEERAQRTRLEMLRIYKSFLDRGVPTDDVPKWARDQLAEMASAN